MTDGAPSEIVQQIPTQLLDSITAAGEMGVRVLEEIKEFASLRGFTLDQVECLGGYTNNFGLKIGNALLMGKIPEERLRDSLLAMFERWATDKNRPIEDIIGEHKERGFTEKLIRSQYGDFLEDIRVAISESGVDSELLHEYIDRIRPNDYNKQILILSVYIKMREKGYSHQDIRC